jgi:uncharacterized cupin superfamily protein
MPKIDISKIAPRLSSAYPPAFKAATEGRAKYALGDAVGLNQFGVNLTRLKPGAASSHRHWHENEDEFIFVLEGEIVLIEDTGETLLGPGDAAGFKAGVANGHHLINKSSREALYLEVGTRAPTERSHYPDVDLAGQKDERGFRFTRKSGEPIPPDGGS